MDDFDTISTNENYLPFVLSKAHYAVKSFLDEFLKTVGSDLTPPESYLLNFIGKNDTFGGVPFARLMNEAKVSKGTLSECLSNLGRKKMIDAYVDPEDRRKKSFACTAEGRRVVAKTDEALKQAQSMLLAELGEQEASDFIATCYKLLEISKKQFPKE